MKDVEGKILRSFISRSQAADWLIQNGYSKASRREVVTVIGRVANHKRKSAYGFVWDKI